MHAIVVLRSFDDKILEFQLLLKHTATGYNKVRRKVRVSRKGAVFVVGIYYLIQ